MQMLSAFFFVSFFLLLLFCQMSARISADNMTYAWQAQKHPLACCRQKRDCATPTHTHTHARAYNANLHGLKILFIFLHTKHIWVAFFLRNPVRFRHKKQFRMRRTQPEASSKKKRRRTTFELLAATITRSHHLRHLCVWAICCRKLNKRRTFCALVTHLPLSLIWQTMQVSMTAINCRTLC